MRTERDDAEAVRRLSEVLTSRNEAMTYWSYALLLIVAVATYFRIWWLVVPLAIEVISIPIWRICAIQHGYGVIAMDDTRAILRELQLERTAGGDYVA